MKRLLVVLFTVFVGLAQAQVQIEPVNTPRTVLRYGRDAEQQRTTVATVQRVVDGDTLVLDTGEKVRLIGVDTPETVDPRKPVQYFGKEASQYTRTLAEGKRVRLEYDNEYKDRYGRLLAYVYLDDGTMLNMRIIRDGYGFAYVKYPHSKLEMFRECERYARTAQVGLWKPTPTPRPLQTSSAVIAEWDRQEAAERAYRVVTPTPAYVPAYSAPAAVQTVGQTVYVTNSGQKYHRASCTYLRKSQRPMDKSRAIQSGYSPCSRCNP